MYRITLVRPGQPAERRFSTTGQGGGAIRTALWDLLRSTGTEIHDEDHSELIRAAGDLRNMAITEGFGALEVDDGTALTVRFAD